MMVFKRENSDKFLERSSDLTFIPVNMNELRTYSSPVVGFWVLINIQNPKTDNWTIQQKIKSGYNYINLYGYIIYIQVGVILRRFDFWKRLVIRIEITFSCIHCMFISAQNSPFVRKVPAFFGMYGRLRREPF